MWGLLGGECSDAGTLDLPGFRYRPAQQMLKECACKATESAHVIEGCSPDGCPAAVAAPQVHGQASEAPSRGAAGHAGPNRGALRARRAAAHAGAAARAHQLHTLCALCSAVPRPLPAGEKDVSLDTDLWSDQRARRACCWSPSAACPLHTCGVASARKGKSFQVVGLLGRPRLWM